MYIRRKIFSLQVNSEKKEQKEFTRADYNGLDSTSSAELKSERSKVARKLLRDKKNIKRSYDASIGADGTVKELYDSHRKGQIDQAIENANRNARQIKESIVGNKKRSLMPVKTKKPVLQRKGKLGKLALGAATGLALGTVAYQNYKNKKD